MSGIVGQGFLFDGPGNSILVAAAEPRVISEGYQLKRVAAEPDIVTPIGMTVFDGSLLVVESHTHQRREDYTGPAGDRIRRFFDSDGDGLWDQWSTFADGFQQAMNVVAVDESRLLLVTRRDVQQLSDADGDGVCDDVKTLVRLETDVDYPHNGLSGICRLSTGQWLLGLGENFGGEYHLTGSDGKSLTGRGGVGTIFRMSDELGGIERYAIGFWNPFSICQMGRRVFVVDNDPDASPPCRLINVVETGDYGHRWEYGRAGVHPLQAWDGELPGTLPMLCGTGEAPTALVPHEEALWVSSWGDHRIERYQLDGGYSSLVAKREVVVQGDADFRPTGMVVAPDGSLYFADWIDRSYPVHGKGAVWRLQNDAWGGRGKAAEDRAATGGDELASRMQGRYDRSRRLGWLDSDNVWARQRGVAAWVAQQSDIDPESVGLRLFGASARLGWLQVQRWRGTSERDAMLAEALSDADPQVRLYAVRWVADERITALRDHVAALLYGEISDERYYLAILAALEWLDGDGTPRNGDIIQTLLRQELRAEDRPPLLRSWSLRLLPPDDELITMDLLTSMLGSDEPRLEHEVLRTMALRRKGDLEKMLIDAAADEDESTDKRCWAIVGLSWSLDRHRELLERLARGPSTEVSREAKRVLRLAGGQKQGKVELPASHELGRWQELLGEQTGDAISGERLFFSAGAACSNCHRHGGRGGSVGPDLTSIARQQVGDGVLLSILLPNREIAPRYETWVLQTVDGKTRTGMRLPRPGDSGEEFYADAAGATFMLRSAEIELRTPSDASIMPTELLERFSVDDVRDLLAFLQAGIETR
ncbi:MAG: hypothetical protein R3E01_01555 [Pirellulaceae bacterium]|nr:c-type cytochrome [Planctomycetales bacterium]